MKEYFLVEKKAKKKERKESTSVEKFGRLEATLRSSVELVSRSKDFVDIFTSPMEIVVARTTNRRSIQSGDNGFSFDRTEFVVRTIGEVRRSNSIVVARSTNLRSMIESIGRSNQRTCRSKGDARLSIRSIV